MSDGSLEQIDEEFKQPEGKKFEFINENYQEWPKWSLSTEEKKKNDAEEIPKDLNAVQL